MDTSESIKEIANALCAFQGEVGKIRKEATNPFFKSKYATLSQILDVIQEPLTKSGLSIMQMPKGENELITILLHISGEWISESYIMRPVKNDPQGIGSCITYQRRYAIASILCLNIDDDDDGNKASGNTALNSTKNNTNNQPLGKKMFDLKLCERKDFFERIYSHEKEASSKGKHFSLKEFIENIYRIDSNAYNILANKYIEYKTNFSL